MINRFNRVAKQTLTMAAKPVTWSSVTKKARLTLVGLSAISVAVVLQARPDMNKQVSRFLAPLQGIAAPQDEAQQAARLAQATPQEAVSEVDAASAKPLTADEKALLASRKQQQAVTTWLSKRYRVANDAAQVMVASAYLTAREVKIDPLLILAVAAIESGLNPFAESPVGAQGLMQVMSKIHHAKFKPLGGIQAAFNPVANIKVGSQILKEYVTRGGSVEAGLKTYVGAAAFDTDQGYGSRVIAELGRLKQVAAGKKVPTFTKPPAPAAEIAEKVKAPAVTPPIEAPAAVESEQIASL